MAISNPGWTEVIGGERISALEWASKTHRFHTDFTPISHRFCTDFTPILHRFCTDFTPILHRFCTDFVRFWVQIRQVVPPGRADSGELGGGVNFGGLQGHAAHTGGATAEDYFYHFHARDFTEGGRTSVVQGKKKSLGQFRVRGGQKRVYHHQKRLAIRMALNVKC